MHIHRRAYGSENLKYRCLGRSRGGLAAKISARVDTEGRPVRLLISPGNDHDVTYAAALLEGLDQERQIILNYPNKASTPTAYTPAFAIKVLIPNIPNHSNRKKKFPIEEGHYYRQRNRVERFFDSEQVRDTSPPIRQARDHLFGVWSSLPPFSISLRSIHSTA